MSSVVARGGGGEGVWVQQASDVNRRATLGPLLCQVSAGGDGPGELDHWQGG